MNKKDKEFLCETARLLKEAKGAYETAGQKLQKLYDHLGDLDLENTITMAENARDIEEAINCFVMYGEYSLEGLLCEIMEQYDKKKR